MTDQLGYDTDAAAAHLSYDFLEKTMKDRKTTHRNILEIDREYLKSEESLDRANAIARVVED